jgi:nucleotide-binding universal stress UspA family protein
MLPRFQHLLVPLDLTVKNRKALDLAFEIAAQNRARTTLLHVIERIESLPEEDDPEVQEFYTQLAERAAVSLDSLAQRFSDAGLEVEHKTWFGKRVREVVRFATERDVDLVVLSSHAVDTTRPIESLASVSYQVSILCPCPVLMVK